MRSHLHRTPIAGLALSLLLVQQPAFGQAPVGSELGEILGAVLDSVAPRTSEFRGWDPGSIEIIVSELPDLGLSRIDDAALNVLRTHPEVSAVCDPSLDTCRGGDYRMLTWFHKVEVLEPDRVAVEVSLRGDDGSRGAPNVAFQIGWRVIVERRGVWRTAVVELTFVT